MLGDSELKHDEIEENTKQDGDEPKSDENTEENKISIQPTKIDDEVPGISDIIETSANSNDMEYDREVSGLQLMSGTRTLDAIESQEGEKTVPPPVNPKIPVIKEETAQEIEDKKRRRSSGTIKVGSQVPFADVIEHPGLPRLFQTEPPALIAYLVNRMNLLIDACFHGDDQNIACSNAYLILSSQNTRIMSAFLESDTFQMIGAELFMPEELNYSKVGRFVGILSGIVDQKPEEIIDHCGFLPRMVHHCYFPVVSSFLVKLCKDDPRLKNVHKYLINFGFHEMLYRELKSFQHVEYATEIEYYQSKGVYRIATIFKIISYAVSLKTMMKYFKTSTFLTECETIFHPNEHMIETEKWKLILALADENYASTLLNFLYAAVELLKQAVDGKFHMCHYYALLYLSQMLRFSSETPEVLIAFGFVPVLFKLVFNFQNNNYFVEAFRKVILSSLRREDIFMEIYHYIIPALLAISKDLTQINLTASIFYIVQVFENTRGELKYLDRELSVNPQYIEYLDSEYKIRTLIYENNYGESIRGQLGKLINS